MTVIGLMGLVTACTSMQSPPSASPAPSVPSSASDPSEPSVPQASIAPLPATALGEVIALAPAPIVSLDFTNWRVLKDQAGFPDLTGESSTDQQDEFYHQFMGSQNPPEPPHLYAGGQLTTYVRTLGSDWGFTLLDLDWEADLVMVDRTVASVVRFRDGYDLTALTDLLDLRGYDEQAVGGAILRTHDFSVETWARMLIMLNLAILPDQRTLILTAEPANLDRMVEGRSSGSSSGNSGNTSFEAMADALGDPAAAHLLDGLYACNAVDPANRPIPDSVVAEIDAADLHEYRVLAVSYSLADDPIGQLAFLYDDATVPAADLAGRQTLAATGHAIESGQPYAVFFAVEGAEADGALLTLTLRPTNDAPQLLFTGIVRRDMTFASCGL